MLEALGNKNDVLITISTSGNSKNIIKVLKKAKNMKIRSVALLGKKKEELQRITVNIILL